MSDREVVALAACAAVGAWAGFGPGVRVGALAVALALLLRRPWLLCIAVALLAGGRAASDRAGLGVGPSGPFAGAVALATDPVSLSPGVVRVEVVVDGAHADATARGDAASMLSRRAAGDRVRVRGDIAVAAHPTAAQLRRHVVRTMQVSVVDGWADGGPQWAAANALRDALARSSLVLPERQQGLYLGLVLGDDRDEPVDIADDFKGAGMTHLLAVSGQNVAFALSVVAPLLRRVGLRTRFVLTIGALALFVVATRAEPSVLRAAAMAGGAAVATTAGRPASGVRILGLAVAALLVADPFLVDSIGFRLSVAASAAIILLSRAIAARLPGPRPLAEAMGVTVAAQVGVAPILATTFGSVPVASIVANVVAAPAAGPVMAYGIVAGVAGGVGGHVVAWVAHLPTTFLVWWLTTVARWGARLPLGQLGGAELVVLGVAVVLFVVARRRPGPLLPALALTVAATALLAPAVALRRPPPVRVALGSATLWRAGGTVLVVGPRARAPDVLAGLREQGADRLDLVVATSTSTGLQATLDAIALGHPVGSLITPVRLPEGGVVVVGRLVVAVTRGDSGLSVDVTLAR